MLTQSSLDTVNAKKVETCAVHEPVVDRQEAYMLYNLVSFKESIKEKQDEGH